MDLYDCDAETWSWIHVHEKFVLTVFYFTFQVFNLQSRRAAAENREFNFSFIKGTVRHPNVKKKLVSLLKSGQSCFDWRQF